MKALLALEDGLTLWGRSFTGAGECAGEVVFNTAMTGYQEVLTDPSYKGQIVTMTYPLMGNYGVNPEDLESRGVQVEGFIVKEYHPYPSNWRAQGNLADYLKSAGKLGVEGLDTRAITKAPPGSGGHPRDYLDPGSGPRLPGAPGPGTPQHGGPGPGAPGDLRPALLVARFPD